MLRGPCWTFYAQMSTFDLLSPEVHAGPFMLRGPCRTFYAQRSRLDILCSEVHAGQVYSDRFDLIFCLVYCPTLDLYACVPLL